jgi:superfamily II DNA/RNA helicase
MPPKIRTLAHKILHQPEQINISISKPAEGVTQQAYMAYDTQKLKLLHQILKQEEYSSIIIFAGTKEKVKGLEREVQRIIPSSKSFHSNLEQAEREEIMRIVQK